MVFHYVAANAEGKMVEGDFEGNVLNDALQYLAGRELRPISVKEVKSANSGWKNIGGSITTEDKVFLTKYIALMLRVGTDLLSAINILIADFDKPAVRSFLTQVRDDLGRGRPFYETFERHPESFSPTFVSLVKAAEASGSLEKTFNDLSAMLEQEAELKSRIRSAMVYPIVLVSAASGIIVFLSTFALPKVAGVFSNSGIKPPLFSQIVLGTGLFIGQNIIAIAVTLAVLIGGGIWVVRKTDTGRRAFSNFLAHLPVINGIYRDLAIQRMASTISSLMKAGLPIMQTISVASETVGLREYKDALVRIANDGLAKGFTVGEAFKREQAFPKMVSNLVAISEKAGHIDEVLNTLAQFYAATVDERVKSAVALLEPVLLLLMGMMVALIALSIIVPIYQLTSSF
ncbi:MAG TPA: type II secretion system F family protein [Candidatus Paceibacterota bacterium]|nr:type II secretion system F family protein [Candidatus Paceibacterota bacterium]